MASPHHLKLDGVSFTYPGSVRRVLTDITFAVPSEHVTGLIGENGSGKSTLLQLIAGSLEPDVGSITTPPTTGFIEQETQLPFSSPASALIDAAVSELRDVEKQIGEISEKMAEDPDRYAEAFDAALAMAEQAGVWELDARIATVLAGLGLANVPLETTLGDMSGGQRRRFALAALLLRPVDAMVLDEPTNHLDDDGVDFLIRELEEFSGPVLVASHDRFFLDKAADSLVDLDAGLGHEGGGGEDTRQGTLFTGSFTDYLESREDIRRRWEELYTVQEHERARLEKAAEQTAEDVFHSQESKSEVGIAKKFHADRAAKTVGNRLRSARNRLEALERDELPKPPARLKFHGIPEHTSASLGEPAVWAKDIWVGDRLGPLTIKINPGEHWLIEGPNGAGKSTFLKVVQGKWEITEGELRIPEEVVVGRLSQDDEWIDLEKPAEEIFAEKVPPKSPSLVDMGLMTEETAARPLGELSLGQRRRVSLGIILASPPDILLLDEPTNHLSLALAEELEEALSTFPGTVLMATHDRWIRRRWAVRTDGRGRVLSLPGRRDD
ncbi:macrolide transport system ATP-binding/permease protein [Corynebacterium pollutisoli]|uniref:Macrolide transport system ATP-binding/permease protein n=1 Tax=Corynebacterium pollutisoli TaxID=1610489 RepID=A0A1X7I468_9CORY|nr:ABC-F family ATP-binding cassette domain-containing protein [Corynebacterium pollutisoli]SMG09307.1 macrolide transport system ATP-binding/permease protein [Corynebacterium pollutisoli]